MRHPTWVTQKQANASGHEGCDTTVWNTKAEQAGVILATGCTELSALDVDVSTRVTGAGLRAGPFFVPFLLLPHALKCPHTPPTKTCFTTVPSFRAVHHYARCVIACLQPFHRSRHSTCASFHAYNRSTLTTVPSLLPFHRFIVSIVRRH